MTIKIKSPFGEKEFDVRFLDVFIAVGLNRDVRPITGKTVEFSTVFPMLMELNEWMWAAGEYTLMHYNEPEKNWPGIIRVATKATNIHPEMWGGLLRPLLRWFREICVKDGWNPNKERSWPAMRTAKKCTCTIGEVSNFTIKYLSELQMLDPALT